MPCIYVSVSNNTEIITHHACYISRNEYLDLISLEALHDLFFCMSLPHGVYEFDVSFVPLENFIA